MPSYAEAAYRTGDVWVMFKCADCDPAGDADYEKPWVLLLPKGEDAKGHTEVCGRCGSYLGIMATGEFVIEQVAAHSREQGA